MCLKITCLNSYNPYDGPNDNPEVELPLTAGEYIYVYGDMDDDGFYEGKSGVCIVAHTASYSVFTWHSVFTCGSLQVS